MYARVFNMGVEPAVVFQGSTDSANYLCGSRPVNPSAEIVVRQRPRTNGSTLHVEKGEGGNQQRRAYRGQPWSLLPQRRGRAHHALDTRAPEKSPVG